MRHESVLFAPVLISFPHFLVLFLRKSYHFASDRLREISRRILFLRQPTQNPRKSTFFGGNLEEKTAEGEKISGKRIKN